MALVVCKCGHAKEIHEESRIGDSAKTSCLVPHCICEFYILGGPICANCTHDESFHSGGVACYKSGCACTLFVEGFVVPASDAYVFNLEEGKVGESLVDEDLALWDKATEIMHVRAEKYGHPRENFQNIAQMWSVIFGIDVTESQVAWAMVAMKMCRDLNEQQMDNALDAMNYAGISWMVKKERE